jgi:hypothetical protein
MHVRLAKLSSFWITGVYQAQNRFSEVTQACRRVNELAM